MIKAIVTYNLKKPHVFVLCSHDVVHLCISFTNKKSRRHQVQ